MGVMKDRMLRGELYVAAEDPDIADPAGLSAAADEQGRARLQGGAGACARQNARTAALNCPGRSRLLT